MKFATHSPAPWRARRRRVVDANGAEICEVHKTITRPLSDDCWELAHFISLAPEMLQLLGDAEALLRVIASGEPNPMAYVDPTLHGRIARMLDEAKRSICA